MAPLEAPIQEPATWPNYGFSICRTEVIRCWISPCSPECLSRSCGIRLVCYRSRGCWRKCGRAVLRTRIFLNRICLLKGLWISVGGTDGGGRGWIAVIPNGGTLF